MTEDTSPEKLRKFLLSEDPAMRLEGISMAKGVDLAESNQIIMALSYWDTNEKVKEAANEIKEEEEYDSEEEALGSFDYCPLWIKIYHIENASSSSHWPEALDYEATQFYELIVERYERAKNNPLGGVFLGLFIGVLLIKTSKYAWDSYHKK